jgi:hypothetical protein
LSFKPLLCWASLLQQLRLLPYLIQKWFSSQNQKGVLWVPPLLLPVLSISQIILQKVKPLPRLEHPHESSLCSALLWFFSPPLGEFDTVISDCSQAFSVLCSLQGGESQSVQGACISYQEASKEVWMQQLMKPMENARISTAFKTHRWEENNNFPGENSVWTITQLVIEWPFGSEKATSSTHSLVCFYLCIKTVIEDKELDMLGLWVD